MSYLTVFKTAFKAATGGTTLYLYGALIAVGAVAVGSAFLWHGAQVREVQEAAFKDGQDLTQAKWDQAVADAKDAQAKQSWQATEDFVTEREVVRVVYRDRIKEIKTYVPSPGTNCPADPCFLQRYNAAASPASDAPDQ